MDPVSPTATMSLGPLPLMPYRSFVPGTMAAFHVPPAMASMRWNTAPPRPTPNIAPPVAPHADKRAGSEISVVARTAPPDPRIVTTVPHHPPMRRDPSPRLVMARRFCPVPADRAVHVVPLKWYVAPVLPTA